jgi:type I restriction enzyme R subunit
MPTPESIARQQIDQLLAAFGWTVQDRADINLHAARGVAVREFPVESGFADYILFVDRKAAGVVEAKKVGATLSGVAEQAGSYATGLPQNVPIRSLCATRISSDFNQQFFIEECQDEETHLSFLP